MYYGIQTLRAKENFPITGYRIHEEMINALAIVKKAAALANMDVKRLYEGIGNAIVQAADEILEGKWHDQFIVDPIQGGAGTSMNMNANEVIGNRALEIMGHKKGEYIHLSPNTHVNMSQSTNDVFPTAIHISTLKLLDKLLDTMAHMLSVFKDKAKQFDSVIKMGRTHLQDAVPIRLGQEFEAYSRVLERDIKRIKQSRQHLYEVNMGATAVGTGLNADPRYIEQVVKHLADISGLPLVGAGHLVDATQNTDAYTEVSAALKVCMMNMSKIANDLRWMNSGPLAGLGEIELQALQPGSSIMPGKVNPVIPEATAMVAAQVIGNDATIAVAGHAGNFELNVMLPVIARNLLESIELMANVSRLLADKAIASFKVNEDKLKEALARTPILVTALNPIIGYLKAAEIAKTAYKQGRPIIDVALEHTDLSRDQLEALLDPEKLTAGGI